MTWTVLSAREGEHLARAPVPHPCSPLGGRRPRSNDRARLMRQRIALAIQWRSDQRFETGSDARGERLGRHDLAVDNGGDKRGVSNPRTGSGAAAWQNRGVAHAPAPLPTVARDCWRGTERRACEGNADLEPAGVQSFARVSTRSVLVLSRCARRPCQCIRGRRPPPFLAAPLAASAVPK